jgi:hypothetical protein
VLCYTNDLLQRDTGPKWRTSWASDDEDEGPPPLERTVTTFEEQQHATSDGGTAREEAILRLMKRDGNSMYNVISPPKNEPARPWRMDDEDLDDTEKERRRQARAFEQQQRILRQVEAARRMKHKPAAPRDPDDEEALQHQRERQPRTKGLLFTRLSNGLLMPIDRYGNPLRKETPKEEKDTIQEVHEIKHAEPNTKNELVPAPVPKVSAWNQGK